MVRSFHLSSVAPPGAKVTTVRRWVASGKTLFFGIAGALVCCSSSLAAEQLILTYGSFSRSISIQDLENFAETGQVSQSSTLKFLVQAANANPEDLQKVLTYEVALDLDFADSALYSLPGEYVLFEAGSVFHNKPRTANIQALRSAVTLSASNDGKISLLEFLQKYPNQGFYVDGVRFVKVATKAAEIVRRAEKELDKVIVVAKDFLSNLICDCNPAASDPVPTDNTRTDFSPASSLPSNLDRE